MKKSAKLSLAVALMMGVTTGAQMNTASAQISDNFSYLVDGVFSYYNDSDAATGNNPYSTRTGTKADQWFNSYTRFQFKYRVDQNLNFTARIHSSYSSTWNDVYDPADNGSTSKGAYVDQAFLTYNDKASKMNYRVGRHGQYMGQGLVYNASGNLTGVSVGYGGFNDPTQITFNYGNKANSSTIRAIQVRQKVAKNVELSALYFDQDSPSTKQYFSGSYNGKPTTSTIVTETGMNKNEIISGGWKAKMGATTFVGEIAHNKASYGEASKGSYAELYWGPTNDMTGQMPYQKVGTQTFSVRYQNIGNYSVSSPTNGMYKNMEGIRLNYGRVLRKGLSADIAYSRMHNKSARNAEDTNIIVAELAYKFR